MERGVIAKVTYSRQAQNTLSLSVCLCVSLRLCLFLTLSLSITLLKCFTKYNALFQNARHKNVYLWGSSSPDTLNSPGTNANISSPSVIFTMEKKGGGGDTVLLSSISHFSRHTSHTRMQYCIFPWQCIYRQ